MGRVKENTPWGFTKEVLRWRIRKSVRDVLIRRRSARRRNAALNSFNKVLLADHIRTCVADDIRNGKDETIDELAATLNQSGFIRCEASRVGEDTTLSQIIQMVSDAAATKAPIAKIADRVSGVFVPAVIAIVIVTIIVWLAMGETVGFALARGISVLVISCPSALGLATPVAIMVGNGMGAKHGIMFKTAVSLEETGRTQIVALDKTRTITSGEPKVTDMIPAEGVTEEELLTLAYALEQKSEHPLTHAILVKAQESGMDHAPETEDFQAVPGNGLTGRLGTDMLAGIIAVADVIKEDSSQAVRELQNMGICVVMLTGDNEHTARAIGVQAGVEEVIAGVLPDGKESVIRNLKKKGKVAMVGDGINDAPDSFSLTSAVTQSKMSFIKLSN